MVSICLPVYNGERHLGEAIRSILAQTYPAFELLIFDNASTDGTQRIIEAIRDPRVAVHRNSCNMGAEANWNLALEAATGKYIKIVPHDDLLAPECLARQVAALEACPQAVLAFSSRAIIRPDGSLLFNRTTRWPDGEISARDVLAGCLRSGTNPLGEPSSVMFRAETARLVGPFDGSIPYLIDLDYWLRLLIYGSAWCLRAPLASFRVSPNQWSAAIGRRQSRQFLQFIRKLVAAGQPIGPLAQLWTSLMAHGNQFLRQVVYQILPSARP